MSALYAVLSTRVGRRRKFGEVSCTECICQGFWNRLKVNPKEYDFESIPTVKMETINSLEGYFGSEFPAICNHCQLMAAWSRKTLKLSELFGFFLEKRPLTVKFSKFCSKSFHRDTDRRVVFMFREIWPTGNRWNRALLAWQKFRLALCCLYYADRAQNLPGPAPDNVSNVLPISSKSVHFRWGYSRTLEHRQNAPWSTLSQVLGEPTCQRFHGRMNRNWR